MQPRVVRRLVNVDRIAREVQIAESRSCQHPPCIVPVHSAAVWPDCRTTRAFGRREVASRSHWYRERELSVSGSAQGACEISRRGSAYSHDQRLRASRHIKPGATFFFSDGYAHPDGLRIAKAVRDERDAERDRHRQNRDGTPILTRAPSSAKRRSPVVYRTWRRPSTRSARRPSRCLVGQPTDFTPIDSSVRRLICSRQRRL
jgi:hypothetical protein